MPKHILLCQLWTIRENGRPSKEGEFCSLHVDEASRERFLARYWSQMPREVPDSYACPAETARGQDAPPYPCSVDGKTYDRVAKSDIGMWSTTVPKETLDAVSLIPAIELLSLTEGVLIEAGA